MTFYINKTNSVVNKIKFVQATVTNYLKKVFPKHKYMRNKKGQVFQEKLSHMQRFVIYRVRFKEWPPLGLGLVTTSLLRLL